MENNFDLSADLINSELSYNYTGENDVYLDFQGNSGKGDFINMRNSTRRVTFKVTNTTTSQKRMCITPANYKTDKPMLVYLDTGVLYVNVPGGGKIAASNFDPDAVENDIIHANSSILEINKAGYEVDCMLDDGYVYAEAADPTKYVKVEASSKSARISHFLRFINGNPSAGIGFHVGSDKTEMYETEFISQNATPYRGAGQENKIPFQDEFNQYTQNESKITKNAYYQLDGETFSQMLFPGLSAVSVTFIFSVVQSQAAALRRKSDNVRVAGKLIKKEEFILGKPKFVPGT